MRLKLLLAFLLLMLSAVPACAQFRRRPAPTPKPVRIDDGRMSSTTITALPYGRTNPAVAAWRDRVYVVGGTDYDGPTSTLWRFNPYSHDFDTLSPMHEARSGHGAAIVGGRLLVLGGQDENDHPLSSIEAYDLGTGNWESAGNMPFARSRFALAAARGLLWLAGGGDKDSATAEFYAFDARRGHWERKADMPQPRDRLALVALHGKLYAIGGDDGDGHATNTVWRYDPDTNRWSTAAHLIVPRRSLSAVRLGDSIIVTGGFTLYYDQKIFPPHIEVYDARSDEWVSHGHLDWPRDGCRSVAWRGRVLVMGGFKADYVSNIEEITWRLPQASGWRLDLTLKSHLASVAVKEPTEGSLEASRPLSSGAREVPDVADMSFDDARVLGIPLPPLPGENALGLFIKFFEFPPSLAADTSMRTALTSFLVGGTAAPGIPQLIASKGGVVVEKMLVANSGTIFNARNPYPPLRVPTGTVGSGVEAMTPQEFFDRSVLNCGLYVVPTDETEPRHGADEGAESAEGVRALDAEALALMAEAYHPVGSPDPNLACFVDDSEMDQLGDDPIYSILTIPRQPQIFDDWRQRALPLTSVPSYLTGRLIVRRDDVAMPQAVEVKDVTAIRGRLLRSSSLEVDSVLRMR